MRRLATLLSFIFHPVFIPIFFLSFLLYVHPLQFLGHSATAKQMVLLQAIAMFTFFPLVTVLLLRALGFINSIQLKEQKDRIIPLVASGIWYFWIWYVWKNIPGQPQVTVHYALAVWLSSVAALLFNTKFKISLHAIALGSTLGLLLWMAFTEHLYYGIWLSVAFLITGLVCSARLLVGEHRPLEVYAGLLTGALCVVLASFFV
jgi:membrane-associated phospholipid phosphatase